MARAASGFHHEPHLYAIHTAQGQNDRWNLYGSRTYLRA
jgi:hypothetical protein